MWASLGTKVLFCCCLLLRQRRRRPPGTRPVRHLSPPWHPPGPAFEPTLAPAPTGAHPAWHPPRPATTRHPSVSPTATHPGPTLAYPVLATPSSLATRRRQACPPRRRRDQTAAAPSALEPTKPAHQSRQQQTYHGGLFPKRRRGRGATTKACFTL